MTLGVLLDTDVLIKCACYSMLEHIQPPTGVGGGIAIIGAAKFVVRNHLARRGHISDRPSARQRFEDYLKLIAVVEPTEEELALASAIEEAGVQKGVDLDVGESQLCAIAIYRTTPLLLTGDKRAIIGAEALQSDIANLSKLRGRIICLEQFAIGVMNKIGMATVRLLICAEPAVDKSLSICCGCSSDTNDSRNFSQDGLLSYVGYLRGQAPTMLYRLDAMLWFTSSEIRRRARQSRPRHRFGRSESLLHRARRSRDKPYRHARAHTCRHGRHGWRPRRL